MPDLHDLFMKILRKTGKNTTYKFALALFLLEYSVSSAARPPYKVPYSRIAEHFLKYYWSHVCKSKLRQGPKEQIPRVITIIEQEFQDKVYPQTFAELKKKEPERVGRCVDRIRRRCLKDVVPRFQWVSGSRQTAFFSYLSKEYGGKSRNVKIYPDLGIEVAPAAVEFLSSNYAPLRNSVILEWARFLEDKNFGTPNLIRKVDSGYRGMRNQRKFLGELWSIEKRCFYCREKLRRDKSTHVDHVLPYDYIGDTDLWNSVLACQECNCAKLDSLPPMHFVAKLSDRNKRHRSKAMQDSLYKLHYEHGSDGVRGEAAGRPDPSIRWHYDNASRQGYPALPKFPCSRPSAGRRGSRSTKTTGRDL